MKLSVIVPCFNEGKNMLVVIDKFKEIINNNPNLELEVIIVDGNSSDDTPHLLKTKFEHIDNTNNNFKLILMPQRKGYGYDIIAGLHQATGEILAWTHGDLQTDPLDVIKAMDLYVKNYESNKLLFIKGQRKNRRFLEAFFTFGMQLVAFVVLKTYLRDINAQPKMFNREFYNKYLNNAAVPHDFSLDLYALYKAKKNNYRILTVPVYYLKRQYGEAKGGGGSWKNRFKLIKRTFSYIWQLRQYS